ncbi:MAG: hypothetical protein C4555_05105 [Dehalococcoidia bacterium]|nr:MAG: hypothetical protein C4555_05105 [Dehalococcoidia bacterium]
MTLQLVYDRKREITMRTSTRDEVFERLMKTTERLVSEVEDLRRVVDEKSDEGETKVLLQA